MSCACGTAPCPLSSESECHTARFPHTPLAWSSFDRELDQFVIWCVLVQCVVMLRCSLSLCRKDRTLVLCWHGIFCTSRKLNLSALAPDTRYSNTTQNDAPHHV